MGASVEAVSTNENGTHRPLGFAGPVKKTLAGFLDCEYVTALVGTALAAGAVRQLALVTVGALGETGGREEVVAAALGGALFRVAPFRIRHCGIPFNHPGASRTRPGKTSE